MIFGFTAVRLPIILVVREANHHFIPDPQKKIKYKTVSGWIIEGKK